jgi:hypothetical protein
MRKLVVIAGLLLAACTAPKSTMLAENTATISVIGRSPDDRERVIQDALAEAGKITREHGYQYFIIVRAEDASRTGTMLLDDQTVRRSAPSNLSKPGASYVTLTRNLTYHRPGLGLTIRMFHEGEIDPHIQGVWNTDGGMGPADKPQSPKKRPPRRLSG